MSILSNFYLKFRSVFIDTNVFEFFKFLGQTMTYLFICDSFRLCLRLPLFFFLYIFNIISFPNFKSWTISTVEYTLDGSFLEYWLIFLKVRLNILIRGCFDNLQLSFLFYFTLSVFIPSTYRNYEIKA